MSFESQQVVSEHQKQGTFSGLINSMARSIDVRLSQGEVAELRRLKPEHPGSPAFWKLAALHLDDDNLHLVGGSSRDENEKRWAVLLSAMAHGTGLHRSGARLGKALADAGFHELRFIRLLRAGDELLFDEISRTVRFLAAKAEPFDFADLARLLASSEKHWGGAVRRDIARSYYLNIE